MRRKSIKIEEDANDDRVTMNLIKGKLKKFGIEDYQFEMKLPKEADETNKTSSCRPFGYWKMKKNICIQCF